MAVTARAQRRAAARRRRLRARTMWNSWRSPTNAMDRAYARMKGRNRQRDRMHAIACRWPDAPTVKQSYRRRRR